MGSPVEDEIEARSYRQLVAKQVDYAAALRCLVAGDDLSNATKEQLKRHVVESSAHGYRNMDEAISQRVLVLRERTRALKEKVSELQLQQKRLCEVQKRRYPELHNVSFQSMLHCLKDIQSMSNIEKQNLASI